MLKILAVSWTGTGTGPSLGDVSNLFSSHPAGNAPQVGYQLIFSLATGVLIFIAVILSLLYLVWGAFDWITSEGNKQKLDQARNKITLAVIGLIIVFLAFFIVNLIFYFFRIKLS